MNSGLNSKTAFHIGDHGTLSPVNYDVVNRVSVKKTVPVLFFE